MTTATIRERLYDYIRVADDKKVKAIYTLLEDQIVPAADWSEDEDCMAEFNNRIKRWEDGVDKAIPLAEVKAELERLDKEHSTSSAK
ncbi:MAG TPA: hypothetical protein DCO83_13395 [Mucilaginibacter sp.]|nr:hypothetical protein [Mucilaginibacter sp.]